MSFGSSFSDVYLLGQLTWKIVKNAREACGEHAGITVEVSALCAVIGRLEEEIGKPESALFGDSFGEIWIQELQNLVEACRKVMHVLDIILNKYNALNEQERSGRRLWQKIKFGNGEMRSLNELRNKIILYTSSINLYLNMATTGTTGRIEQKMNDHGGVLRDIQLSVNGIAAQLVTKNGHGGSVLTDYTNDDKSVWRDFRRELRNEGFSSSVIHKHKRTILDYVKELGGRGLFDEHISTSSLKKCSGDSELIEVGRTYLSPPSTKLPGLPEPIELQCQLRKDPCSTLLAHSKSKTCGVEVFSSSNTSHQAGNEMNSGSQNHETLSTDLPPLACSTDHVRASFEAETSKCPEKSDMRHEENISANLKREIGLEDKDDTEAKAILGLENGRGAKDDEIDKGDIGEHEKASNQDAFDEDTTDEDIAEGYSTEEDTEHEGDEAELVKDSDDKYGTEPGKNEDQVHSQNVKALSPAQVSNTGLATKDRTRRLDREEEHLQATEADRTRVEVILGLSELPKKGILQAPTIRFFEPEVRETYGYEYQEGKPTFNECDKFPSEHYCRVHATPPLKRSGAKAVKNHCIAKGALSETSHHYRDRYVGNDSVNRLHTIQQGQEESQSQKLALSRRPNQNEWASITFQTTRAGRPLHPYLLVEWYKLDLGSYQSRSISKACRTICNRRASFPQNDPKLNHSHH